MLDFLNEEWALGEEFIAAFVNQPVMGGWYEGCAEDELAMWCGFPL